MKKIIVSLFIGGLLGLSIFSSTQNVSASEIIEDIESGEIQSVPWRSWERNFFLPDGSDPAEAKLFRTIIYNRAYSGYLGRTEITDGRYVLYEGYVYLEGEDRPIPAKILIEEE